MEQKVHDDEDAESVVGVTRYLVDHVGDEDAIKFLQMIQIDKKDGQKVLQFLDSKNLKDISNEDHEYTLNMHAKSLVKVIVKRVQDFNDNTFKPRISSE